MRKFYFIAFVLLSFSSYAQYAKNDNLKSDLIDCFIKTNQVKGYNHVLFIRDLLSDKQYAGEGVGIFSFYILTSETYRHIVIINKDSYEIIDMSEEYVDIIDKLLFYFKESNLSRKDILLYLTQVNLIKKENESLGWRVSDWKLKNQ